MRADKLIRLWPELEPLLKRAAMRLLRSFRQEALEQDDLIQYGAIAIWRTRAKWHNTSYLVKRAEMEMVRKLKQVQRIEEQPQLYPFEAER